MCPLSAFEKRDGWIRVDYHGQQGWVSAAHVSEPSGCQDSAAAAQPVAAGCKVTINYMSNMRSGPGVNSDVLTVLPYGVTLTALERADGWVKVDYYGQQGWVYAELTSSAGC